MRKRRKSTIYHKKNSIQNRITLLIGFATITTFLLFLVTSFGISQPKQSVLGAAVNELAMYILPDSGGSGSTKIYDYSPTTNPYNCTTRVSGAGCYKYDCPSNMHGISGSCQMTDSICCAPGAPTPTPSPSYQELSYNPDANTQPNPGFLSMPSSTSNVGFYSRQVTSGNYQGQNNGGQKKPVPTATPTPTQQTQDIMTYLNDQISNTCTTTDVNGNTVTVADGQQCPNSPYLCANSYCAGLCTSNPSACSGGSGQCQQNGLCQNIPTSGPTPTNAPYPTNPPLQQNAQTPQQPTQPQTQFTPPPQVPNTPILPSQQQSQSNIFQSFFQSIPFFKQNQSNQNPQAPSGSMPTPTPGPLFQGTAALTGAQEQLEIQVFVTIKNGKLVIIAKRADGASVTLSDSATQRLLQLMSLGNLPAIMTNGGSSFIIRVGDTEAVTSLPTSITLPFGTIVVTGPDGEDKQLALTPNDAVQAALQSQALDKVDRKQSLWDYILHGTSPQKLDTLVYITTLPNGIISYAVPGTITKRFIASFPIDISRTVYVSPDTGKVEQITENPISELLDKVSVPYITSTMP